MDVNKSAVKKFIIFSYVFGFALQAAYVFISKENYWLNLAMWAPALAILLSGSYAKKVAWNSLKGFDYKLFPLAFLFGTLPYIIAQTSIFYFGFGVIDASVDRSRLPLVLLVNPLITGLFGALGEEIGWRGFLQPEL